MFSSCKVLDIHAYQVLEQKTPQSDHFEPAKKLMVVHLVPVKSYVHKVFFSINRREYNSLKMLLMICTVWGRVSTDNFINLVVKDVIKESRKGKRSLSHKKKELIQNCWC